MKRFHVHVSVADLERSIRFYTGLFAQPPGVREADYAKWMLDDPRINFAISRRGAATGINHLGLQVDEPTELAALHDRLKAANLAVASETGARCCYAESDKHWVEDPDGVVWESFHTLGRVPVYGADLGPAPAVPPAPPARSACGCAA